MTEEEIVSLFERVARDLDVPRIEALVAGAERSGWRLRHRHRAFLAAGVVLAAGAIVAGTTTGLVPRLTAALSPASRGTGLSAASASTSPRSVPSGSASVSPTPAPSASAGTPAPSLSSAMTTTQIMDDLRSMLPATSTISDVQDTSAPMWSSESYSVEFNYNDGQGAADVQFGIYPPGFLQGEGCPAPYANESPRPAGAPPESCTKKTLPDGSVLIDVVTGTDSWSFYDYEIDVVRPDGVTISLAVGNGTLNPGKPINGILTPMLTRAVPPEAFDVWNAVAESPVWHR